MIYQSAFRRITNPLRRIQNTIKGEYITAQLRSSSTIYLDTDEANYIDSLRGLNGLKAKRVAFKFAMSNGSWSYSELCEAFPNCDPT
jgi:hypothetical protein